MRILLIGLCLIITGSRLFGQNQGTNSDKPLLDSSVFGKWPSLLPVARISKDGHFVAYVIQNQPIGSCTAVIQNTKTNSKVFLRGVRDVNFDSESKYGIFISGDSLGIIKLRSGSVKYITNILSFKFVSNAVSEWFAYQLKGDDEKRLFVRNLSTNVSKEIPSVKEYYFGEDGQGVIVLVESKGNSSTLQSLIWARLKDDYSELAIWRGCGFKEILLSQAGDRLAFRTQVGEETRWISSIWNFNFNDSRATLLVADSSRYIGSGYRIAGLTKFSDNGNILFFDVEKLVNPKKENTNTVRLNIWSYQDKKLQSQQLKEKDNPILYSAAIRLWDKSVIRLQQNEDEFFSYSGSGDFGTIEVNNETNMYLKPRRLYYLVSVKSGERKKIDNNFEISPNGKILVYYDSIARHFFSYETESGITHNISNEVITDWASPYSTDLVGSSCLPRGIAGWGNDGRSIFIYDKYDIWKLDLYGRSGPINLTNGFGSRKNVIFNFPERLYPGKLFSENEELILSAFNMSSKENGFFRVKISKRNSDPELLAMGPYIYEITLNPYLQNGINFSPVKAQSVDAYIVRRMSSGESPNLFFTTDFKYFKALTDIHPERQYNWYTSELHTWKSLDGKPIQGILYKPENFDSTRRYPVIFNYYEKRSDWLNAYLQPENLIGGCNINIPFYASNGYLVFSPDINYIVGDPMQGTYNSVISAVNYVSKFPFVDKTKIGIQGCSFGGVQTNYLVTHSNLFAAACSVSGIADFIGAYGGINKDNGESLQNFIEIGQLRMGETIWQNFNMYIKNSPIFSADKISTPFLMMHTTNDPICLFSDAIEFFTALRRLGKKVWLLEYEDGYHGVWGKSGDDFSIRMKQFFDHYLKGEAPPIWMSRGIPAHRKGAETGLELDTQVNNKLSRSSNAAYNK